jgi:hypothetical protein
MNRQEIIEKARSWYQRIDGDEEIEIYDDAEIDEETSDGGIWVQAWVRITDDDAVEDDE